MALCKAKKKHGCETEEFAEACSAQIAFMQMEPVVDSAILPRFIRDLSVKRRIQVKENSEFWSSLHQDKLECAESWTIADLRSFQSDMIADKIVKYQEHKTNQKALLRAMFEAGRTSYQMLNEAQYAEVEAVEIVLHSAVDKLGSYSLGRLNKAIADCESNTNVIANSLSLLPTGRAMILACKMVRDQLVGSDARVDRFIESGGRLKDFDASMWLAVNARPLGAALSHLSEACAQLLDADFSRGDRDIHCIVREVALEPLDGWMSFFLLHGYKYQALVQRIVVNPAVLAKLASLNCTVIVSNFFDALKQAKLNYKTPQLLLPRLSPLTKLNVLFKFELDSS